MGWRALTNFSSVNVGTVLYVYRNGQITGQPEPQLTGTHPIDIETSTGWVEALVQSTGSESAVLMINDGAHYQMTLRRHDERESGTTMGGNMYGRDWIVRSQIVPHTIEREKGRPDHWFIDKYGPDRWQMILGPMGKTAALLAFNQLYAEDLGTYRMQNGEGQIETSSARRKGL